MPCRGARYVSFVHSTRVGYADKPRNGLIFDRNLRSKIAVTPASNNRVSQQYPARRWASPGANELAPGVLQGYFPTPRIKGPCPRKLRAAPLPLTRADGKNEQPSLRNLICHKTAARSIHKREIALNCISGHFSHRNA